MHICMVVFGDLSFDFRVYREAIALREAGHKITIVASDRSPDRGQMLPEVWEVFDVRLIWVNPATSLRVSYPFFWLRAHRVLRQVTADVFHAHDLDSLWPAAIAARQRRVPLVYDSHELWTEQASLVGRRFIRAFWCWLEKHLISRADRTIAVSRSIGDILIKRYGLGDVTIVRNLPPSRNPVKSNRIRRELRLAKDRVILLYQGGFLTDNGLSEQISAMATVESAALVLIGSGPVEEQLRRQVTDSGLADRVFFLPRVPFPELHEYTCSADIGLCLIKPSGNSFYFSLPNKLFEYMQAGLAVLACTSPEIRAVVEETEAGEVVDPENVEAIGRHLRALIADADLRARYSAAALKAAPFYSWEREAERLLSVYSSLADSHSLTHSHTHTHSLDRGWRP